MNQQAPALFHRILNGYSRILRSVGVAAFSVAGAIGIAALIVYPLWWLATQETVAYNVGFAIVIGSAAILAAARALMARKARLARNEPVPPRRSIRMNVLWGIVVVAAGYATAILYVHHLFAAAIPATIVIVLALGFAVGSSTRRGKNSSTANETVENGNDPPV